MLSRDISCNNSRGGWKEQRVCHYGEKSVRWNVNFTGRTNAKVETPILWPPDVKNWLIGKDPDAGKDWSGEEKGTTEDEMVGWHHRLDGHEFEKAPGVGDGQGGLACCSPWGHKELDTTEQLNWMNWAIKLENSLNSELCHM